MRVMRVLVIATPPPAAEENHHLQFFIHPTTRWSAELHHCKFLSSFSLSLHLFYFLLRPTSRWQVLTCASDAFRLPHLFCPCTDVYLSLITSLITSQSWPRKCNVWVSGLGPGALSLELSPTPWTHESLAFIYPFCRLQQWVILEYSADQANKGGGC